MANKPTGWRESPNSILLPTLLGLALLIGCGGEAAMQEELSLIDSTSVPAIEGTPGWGFSRSTMLDLDEDGETERVVLIANVSVMNGRPLWEDAHVWQAYVEEPDSRKTYLYGRLVSHGYIDILVSPADEGPRLLLVERMQQRMAVYGIRYAAPEDIEVEVLLHEAVDPRAGILGSS